jgi:hypothetical protein
MSKIKFSPWVGANYNYGIGGCKVLVLGESHYCANLIDEIPEITINVIKDLMDPNSKFEEYKNTYTKFVEALAGKDISWNNFPEMSRVWNLLAFYNYVQEALSGPREAPSTEQFRNSEGAFWDVLDKLRPNLVIVWGSRLYNNLPRVGFQGPDARTPDGQGIETWSYYRDNYEVCILPITHPSAGFTPEYWHKVIEDFIKDVILNRK